MSEKYSARFFWSGVITIVLGLIVLFNATVVSGAIVVVTGLILLLGGAAQVALGFLDDNSSHKWLSIGIGALTLLLGWSFLSNPLTGVISLTTFLLILLAVSGVFQIIFGFRTRGTPYFWPCMIAGLVSLGLALLLMSSPSATMSLLGILLGIHMLASGASLMLMGMFLKTVRVLVEK